MENLTKWLHRDMKKEEMLRLAGIHEQLDYPYNCGYMIGAAKAAIRNLGYALQMSEIHSGSGDQDKALSVLMKAIQEVTANLQQDIQKIQS